MSESVEISPHRRIAIERNRCLREIGTSLAVPHTELHHAHRAPARRREISPKTAREPQRLQFVLRPPIRTAHLSAFVDERNFAKTGIAFGG